MGRPLYQKLKSILPAAVRGALSRVNQALFARRTLQRKYGDWFDVDWRRKFRTLTDEEWKNAYDRAWKHRRNDCVGEGDANLFLTALEPPGSVLDIGCGMGGLAMQLARKGHAVTGMDVSREALALAREHSGPVGETIEWKEGFAEKLPFPDKSFDYVVSAHTIEHVKDLHAAVSEFKRVARRKIAILTPRQSFKLYMDNYHTQFFETEESLVSAFGLIRFECREVESYDESNHFQGTAWFYVGWLE